MKKYKNFHNWDYINLKSISTSRMIRVILWICIDKKKKTFSCESSFKDFFIIIIK